MGCEAKLNAKQVNDNISILLPEVLKSSLLQCKARLSMAWQLTHLFIYRYHRQCISSSLLTVSARCGSSEAITTDADVTLNRKLHKFPSEFAEV